MLPNNRYCKDDLGADILLSASGEQVMMAWEKNYMEASIDELCPAGDVLEIGFGLGYSASRIMGYRPRSYTLIECDSGVISHAKEWALQYKEYDTEIHIIEGRWQDVIHKMGVFDRIYFDDYPLVPGSPDTVDSFLSYRRVITFIDICVREHTRIGSCLSWYSHSNDRLISLGSDTDPFVKIRSVTIPAAIPSNCLYRDASDPRVTIHVVTKVEEFSHERATEYARQQIERRLAKILTEK